MTRIFFGFANHEHAIENRKKADLKLFLFCQILVACIFELRDEKICFSKSGAVDQRLCFHCIDCTIPLLPNAIFCDCTAWFVSDVHVVETYLICNSVQPYTISMKFIKLQSIRESHFIMFLFLNIKKHFCIHL